MLKLFPSTSYSCSDSFLHSSSRAKNTPKIRKLRQLFYNTPTALLHTEHGNLEVFVATVLSPVQKALVFFTFIFNPFFCHSFFPSCLLSQFYLFPLFPSSRKSSASRSSFAISSITIANKRGLSTEPWCTPTFRSNSSDFLPSFRKYVIMFNTFPKWPILFSELQLSFSVPTKSLLLGYDQMLFLNH